MNYLKDKINLSSNEGLERVVRLAPKNQVWLDKTKVSSQIVLKNRKTKKCLCNKQNCYTTLLVYRKPSIKNGEVHVTVKPKPSCSLEGTLQENQQLRVHVSIDTDQGRNLLLSYGTTHTRGQQLWSEAFVGTLDLEEDTGLTGDQRLNLSEMLCEILQHYFDVTMPSVLLEEFTTFYLVGEGSLFCHVSLSSLQTKGTDLLDLLQKHVNSTEDLTVKHWKIHRNSGETLHLRKADLQATVVGSKPENWLHNSYFNTVNQVELCRTLKLNAGNNL